MQLRLECEGTLHAHRGESHSTSVHRHNANLRDLAKPDEALVSAMAYS